MKRKLDEMKPEPSRQVPYTISPSGYSVFKSCHFCQKKGSFAPEDVAVGWTTYKYIGTQYNDRNLLLHKVSYMDCCVVCRTRISCVDATMKRDFINRIFHRESCDLFGYEWKVHKIVGF